MQNALKQATAPLEHAQAAVSAVSREQGNSKWRKVKAAPLLRYRENVASGEWSANGRGPSSGSAVATDERLHSPAAHRARLRLKGGEAVKPNPSIERTTKITLRVLSSAAHVER